MWRRTVVVSVRNDGRRSAGLTVTANAYRTDGPWTIHVPPGREREERWSARASGNWYDLTVADPASGFARRVAGRIETGADGISDPGDGDRARLTRHGSAPRARFRDTRAHVVDAVAARPRTRN